MPKEITHECNKQPKDISIEISNKCWVVFTENKAAKAWSILHITNIKHCPWCGANLKRGKQSA